MHDEKAWIKKWILCWQSDNNNDNDNRKINGKDEKKIVILSLSFSWLLFNWYWWSSAISGNMKEQDDDENAHCFVISIKRNSIDEIKAINISVKKREN